ncbi:hypothetical protein JR338_05680 [Chloroflexota bacterium]|nr:hypothetical protein JR338_05680 [Chloroflexota bacterium]
MIKRQIYFVALLIFLPMLSIGCSKQLQIFISSPEEIATRYIQENREDGFTVTIDSVKSIQTIEHNDAALILVQYDGERQGVGQEKCEVVLEVKHNSIAGWKINNGAGLCHEINNSENPAPITVVSSWGYSSLFGDRYSTVFGYVCDPQIVKVAVMWDDGQEQAVEVYMSTYFIVRNGESHMTTITAYDAQGEIVFTEDLVLELPEGN